MPAIDSPPPKPLRTDYQKTGDKFTYSELNPGEVRLLTLFPRVRQGQSGENDPSKNATIACKVEVFRLGDIHGHYDTLSYAWGDREERTITVNGNADFKIRKNLLGNLPENVKTTDALDLLNLLATCAAEQNGGQDKHLTDIGRFSVALGKRTNVAETHTSHFEAVKELFKLEWWRRTWVIQELALPPEIQLLVDDKELCYLTLKNAVEGLARHSMMDCCKGHRLGLSGLGFETIVTIEERIGSMVFIRQQRVEGTPTSFTELRRRLCGSEVSWKRDSFYGFFGIATTTVQVTDPRTDEVTSKLIFEPSYTSSVRTALSQAVFGCLRYEDDGVELLLGERLFRTQNPHVTSHVPTWVSDACFCTFPERWALMERRRLSMYASFCENADLGEMRKRFLEGLTMSKNCLLTTKSRRVAAIGKLGAVLVDEDQRSRVPSILLSWMEMAEIGDKWDWVDHAQLNGRKNAFWRTMINDSADNDGVRLSYRRPTIDPVGKEKSDFEKLRALWLALEVICNLKLDRSTQMSQGGQAAPEQQLPSSRAAGVEPSELHDLVVYMQPKLVYRLLACLWERRLFLTNDDSKPFGLCPKNALEGDEIHIIPGCPAPFILRPLHEPGSKKYVKVGDRATDGLPQYLVVGNGYFHGFMGGDHDKKLKEEEYQKIVLH
ncbi:hypothetical protein QBC40DRAFT_267209 [Triangularia verruculosa]|uniref:Heterokaryon incompatibility domain-containing protein n=1 Tax=Triangularia verruculosa TaxID=2587418 RepID=A0AAN7ATE9_9PEZI|nr:hypothetical protein QBC40DRAFT_267209 [Triangularia verruculosa]